MIRCLAIGVLFGWSLVAQAPTGTIIGGVSDGTGAIVPGVKITIESESTGFKQTQSSGTDGRFVQPSLLPGSYRVVAEKAGFSKFITTRVNLVAAETGVGRRGDEGGRRGHGGGSIQRGGAVKNGNLERLDDDNAAPVD